MAVTLRQGLLTGAVVALYLSLNCTLNLSLKWALGIHGFRFPFLLTTAHMLFGFVTLGPVMLTEQFRPLHKATLSAQWKGLVYVALFMAGSIALNNVSLVYISLSLNQVIRSAIPVVTAMLSLVIEKKYITRLEAGSLVILTVGVMVAVWEGAMTGSVYGIGLCLTGMISNAAMMSMSSKVLSEKVDAFRMTFYCAPISCAVMMPLFLLKEYDAASEYMAVSFRIGVAILAVTSINALAYNIVHNLMIKMTSAVTTTVIGEVKVIGLMVASAFLLGEGQQFTMKMLVGCVLAMTGFVLYSHAKMAAQAPAAAKAGGLEGGSGITIVAHCQAPEEVQLLNKGAHTHAGSDKVKMNGHIHDEVEPSEASPLLQQRFATVAAA